MSKTRAVRLIRAAILLALAVILPSCTKKSMTDAELASYVKARDSYLRGDYAKTIETIDAGRFNYASGHQAFLLQAKSEFFSQSPERAEATLRKILKIYPRYSEAELWLARSILAQGRVDEAEKEIERAMEWNPEDPRLLSLMGSVQETKKQYQKAFEYYGRSAAFADETGKDEIALAELYWRFGQTDKALERIGRARAFISEESPLYRPLVKLEERIKKEQTP